MLLYIKLLVFFIIVVVAVDEYKNGGDGGKAC